MRCIILPFLLASTASASLEEFKTKLEASAAAISALNEKALSVAAPEVPTTMNAAEKTWRFIRGLYTTDPPFDDDNVLSVYGTPNGVCASRVITSNNCYSTASSTTYLGPNYDVGPCEMCYTDLSGNPPSAFSCYTCPSGYTLLTYSNINATCTGACVKNTDFAPLSDAANLVPIATSECWVFGGCYPITCNGNSGSCSSSSKSVTVSCFSGSDTVTLESGASKALSEVRVGDMILTADAKGELSFSGVVALPHGANADAATFFDVATASGKHVKATEMHLLKTCSGALAYAGSLKQGDCLRTVDGDEAIVSVETVQGKGLYTVVTMNEFPVIGGIVASPFAVTHGFGNAYYNIHRALYKFAPALMQSSAVASANALVGTAVMLAAGFFNSGSN